MKKISLLSSAILAGSLLTSCTVQKVTDTGRWFGQQNGLSFDRSVEALGVNNWRFSIATSTLGLTSNIHTAVDEVTQSYCSGKTPKVVIDEMSEGIHNTMTGGQRWAKGRFHCE